MILLFTGIVVGFLVAIIFQSQTEAEIDSRQLTELLESVTPQQMGEMSHVLTPFQAALIASMSSRREHAKE